MLVRIVMLNFRVVTKTSICKLRRGPQINSSENVLLSYLEVNTHNVNKNIRNRI